jgi:hypothetical protein
VPVDADSILHGGGGDREQVEGTLGVRLFVQPQCHRLRDCSSDGVPIKHHGPERALNTGDGAAVLYEKDLAVTNGSFLLIEGSSRSVGCFCRNSAGAASLGQCSFLNNSVGAISHTKEDAGVTRVVLCYFQDTKLRGGEFTSTALVTVDSCLFAGEVLADGPFHMRGDQVNFTWTETKFDTASLLAICGGITGLRHVVDMSYSSFVDTEAAEPTEWAFGGFNESGFVEGSADVASQEFPSGLRATDQFGAATELRQRTFVVELSPEGASPLGAPTTGADPSVVEGSLFRESGMEAPTFNADLSAVDDEWGLGAPTGFEALSFDIVVSSLGGGPGQIGGSGVSGLTDDVAASGAEA